MPSKSLTDWQTRRLTRLNEIEAQCAATLAIVPPNPDLADENLRGYVMLLSAHFQGFCRDLYTEGSQFVTSSVPLSMQFLVQQQCATGLELNGANPRYSTIRRDFERFGFDLGSELAMDPSNAPRVTLIDHLNAWRNYAAHHKLLPPAAGGPFILATVRDWKGACDGMAAELDRIVYNQLVKQVGQPPW
jgi:hypothetical protein